MLRGRRVVAVLDFDYLGLRKRAFELAYSSYWALDRLGRRSARGQVEGTDLDRVGALLAAYHASAPAPLTGSEWAALPYQMARVPLYYLAEAGYTPDPVARTLAFARHLPRAAWLAEHADGVAARLART